MPYHAPAQGMGGGYSTGYSTNTNRMSAGQGRYIPPRAVRKGDNDHDADDAGAMFGRSFYTVRLGDTLSRIARRFGVSQTAILRANPAIVNPDLIFAGQTLVIPFAGRGPAYTPGAAMGSAVMGGYGSPMAPQARYGTAMPHMVMPAPQPVPPPAQPPVQPPAPMPAPGPQTVTVNLTARNLAFNMSTITVPASAMVVVNFNNQDAGVPHNFAVYTNSSAQQVIFRGQIITGPGMTTYTFTAPSQPGTYFFRCDVHFTMMTGQFEVR